MQHQSGGVEQFVSKGVAVEGFVFQKSRMQTDGDRAGVEAQRSATNQFVAALLETRHAQPVVVHVQPSHREPVGNPRQKHRFDVTREGVEDGVHHVFGNFGGCCWDGRIGQRTRLALAHGLAKRCPFMRLHALEPQGGVAACGGMKVGNPYGGEASRRVAKAPTWACRSVGRSLPWHGRGPEFKSRHVHSSCF